MPATKTKRKVSSKDTARRVYEYEREQAERSSSKPKRTKEGPTVSPVHLLPGDGLVKETTRKIKKKQRRESNY